MSLPDARSCRIFWMLQAATSSRIWRWRIEHQGFLIVCSHIYIYIDTHTVYIYIYSQVNTYATYVTYIYTNMKNDTCALFFWHIYEKGSTKTCPFPFFACQLSHLTGVDPFASPPPRRGGHKLGWWIFALLVLCSRIFVYILGVDGLLPGCKDANHQDFIKIFRMDPNLNFELLVSWKATPNIYSPYQLVTRWNVHLFSSVAFRLAGTLAWQGQPRSLLLLSMIWVCLKCD